jgi:hypothetical protein
MCDCPSIASLQRQAAAAQKAEEAQRLVAIFRDILNGHRQDFPPAQRPVAPPPVLPDESKIHSRHEHAAFQGLACSSARSALRRSSTLPRQRPRSTPR